MSEKTNNFLKIVTLVSIAVAILAIVHTNEPPLPPISPDERWGDFNNIDARIKFCQAMGYEYGSAARYGSFGPEEYQIVNIGYGQFEGRSYEYVLNPNDAQILCKRTPPQETKAYSYEQYKRWMIAIQLSNRSTP